MVPLLRQRDYDAAVSLMLARISNVVAEDRGVVLTRPGLPGLEPSETRPKPQVYAPPPATEHTPWTIGWFLLLLLFLLGTAGLCSVLAIKLMRRTVGRKWEWLYEDGGRFGAGGFGGSGGFGGFGGGFSGGGGAGGSW
jgi:uncharacterized protein